MLQVQAAGTAPLHYQWQRDGQDIADATNDSFAIALFSEDDTAFYRVVVSNGAGSVTSADAKLDWHVDDGPSTFSQPSVRTAGVGANSDFTASFQRSANGPPVTAPIR